jgi:hypothetical protein
MLFGTFFSTLPTPSNLFFTECRKSTIIILVTGAGGIFVIQMDPNASRVEAPPTLWAERIDVYVHCLRRKLEAKLREKILWPCDK